MAHQFLTKIKDLQYVLGTINKMKFKKSKYPVLKTIKCHKDKNSNVYFQMIYSPQSVVYRYVDSNRKADLFD